MADNTLRTGGDQSRQDSFRKKGANKKTETIGNKHQPKRERKVEGDNPFE